MSHHLMTVCVVCVLCAAHTPCSAHTDLSSPPISQFTSRADTSDIYMSTPDPYKQFLAKTLPTKNSYLVLMKNRGVKKTTQDKEGAKRRIPHISDDKEAPSIPLESSSQLNLQRREVMERLGQVDASLELDLDKGTQGNERRLRRSVNIDEEYFIKKLFESYGDGNSLTIEGFEKLMRKLGLVKLAGELSHDDVSQNSLISGAKQHSSRSDSKEKSVEKSINKERCLQRRELFNAVLQDDSYVTATKNNTIIPDWLFNRVCPALVLHLAAESSSERDGCIKVPQSYTQSATHEHYSEEMTRDVFQVWLYSSVSILIISLCGLLGVAVIPVMGKSYYHQLLQFLVALAIGTLCGDALIHLLPHAMMSSHSHDGGHETMSMIDHEAAHNENMWKGLVAMLGLVLFFFTEKALTLIAERRKQHQKRNKLPQKVKVMRESDGPNSNTVGEKLCKHKYSSYPYCYGEIATDANDTHHNHQHNNHEKPASIDEEKPLTSNCNSVQKIMMKSCDLKGGDNWKAEESMMAQKTPDIAESTLNEPESYTVIIREHENRHHGHTHSHGHVHSAPETLSNVAWMVIMGDGLHNFTDGMAIGAAFSANIAGGFSTAIAVLCHELPHEIGDFAVLLKAGMSLRQAVFYNMLSSVLCLFGMIFGVLLGSTPSASSWMFAAAAGMFIYIALVDMIPELSSSHSSKGGSHWQCIIQASGLGAGLGIMLLIALYEHDLKNIFSEQMSSGL